MLKVQIYFFYVKRQIKDNFLKDSTLPNGKLTLYQSRGAEVNGQLRLFNTYDVVQWMLTHLRYWLFVNAVRC